MTLTISTLIHTVIAYLFRTDVYSSLFLEYTFVLSEIPPRSLTVIPTIPFLSLFILVKTKILLVLIICASLLLFSSGVPVSVLTSLAVFLHQRKKLGLL